MARNKPKTIMYRRKRQKKTDYKKRLSLLTSKKPRLVVRFTNSRIIAQLVTFHPQGDKVEVALDSTALKKHGWNYSLKNIPAAYLTGLLFGKQALAKKHNEAILDTGLRVPLKKGKVYAFLQGVVDSGLQVPHGDQEIFSDEDRTSGVHVQSYATSLKDRQEIYQQRFAQYLKNKAQPEEIVAAFTKIKQELMK